MRNMEIACILLDFLKYTGAKVTKVNFLQKSITFENLDEAGPTVQEGKVVKWEDTSLEKFEKMPLQKLIN